MEEERRREKMKRERGEEGVGRRQEIKREKTDAEERSREEIKRRLEDESGKEQIKQKIGVGGEGQGK